VGEDDRGAQRREREVGPGAPLAAFEQSHGQERHSEREVEIEEAPEEGPVVGEGEGEQGESSRPPRRAQDREDAEGVGDGREEDDDAHGELHRQELRKGERDAVGEPVERSPRRQLVELAEAEPGIAQVPQYRQDREVLGQVRHREVGEEERRRREGDDRRWKEPARDAVRWGGPMGLHAPRGVAQARPTGQTTRTPCIMF
jgi:hypothetical protein